MHVLLSYVSQSGNTEELASMLSEYLNNADPSNSYQVGRVGVFDPCLFDSVLYGSYTWGDGNVPEKVIEELLNWKFSNDPLQIYVGVFGTGDTMFPKFCGATDKIMNFFEGKGGITLHKEPLKIEQSPHSLNQKPTIEEWAKRFIKGLLYYRHKNGK